MLSSQRIKFILITCLYFFVFRISYQYVISPSWSYFGLTFKDQSILFELFYFLLAVLPTIIFPLKAGRPSIIILVFHFILMYIPFFVIFPNIYIHSISEIIKLGFSVFVLFSMIALILFYHVPLTKFKFFKFKQSNCFVRYTPILTLFIIFILFIKFNQLFITNFKSAENLKTFIFEESSSNRSIVYKFSHTYTFGFLTYILMWLNGAVLPLVYASGIILKKKSYIILVLLSYAFLFLIAGYKSSFVAIFMFPIFTYIFLKYKSVTLSITCILLSMFTCLTLFSLLGTFFNNSLLYSVSNWLLLRIFSICSLVFIQFYEFFLYNDFTFFSHVTLFNKIVPYPYEHDLGKVIGNYHYGGGINTNGGFWATDGIASMGCVGLLLISFMCSILFYIFDSIVYKYPPKFVFISLLFILINFMNISIFTTILSGGFLLLFLFYYFISPKFLLTRHPCL